MEVCKHFGTCGGCSLLNLNYEKQVEMKINKFIRIFGFEPEEVKKSPKVERYRNRMDFVTFPPFGIGLRERGKWYSCIDIDDCLLATKKMNKIKNLLREFLRENQGEIECYDLKRKTGFLRYLVLREGFFTGEMMVVLITKRGESGKIKEFLEFLRENRIGITSFYQGINDTLSDVSFSFDKKLLFGRHYIKEKICDNLYPISPNSFFQPNSFTLEFLLKAVIEFLDLRAKEKALDLYAGIGTFALEMAKYCSEVEAIESEEENVRLANLAIKLNRIEFKIRKERVEKAGKLFADKMVVDPPRAGLSKKVIGKILDSDAKKIVYVSCNPETQKRDLDFFLEKGWEVEHSLLVDQFPNTEHLETIISLKRK